MAYSAYFVVAIRSATNVLEERNDELDFMVHYDALTNMRNRQNMDEIFDVKFDLNKENSNGLGLYIVSNILNNYNMEYKALQDEEFFIFKIKIFS